ncbi:MAG: glycosyltransferase [Anaerolineae bacterium]
MAYPISIIIPTYQGAKTLPELLKTLHAQNYPSEIEIVAVDSGSTDGSLDILSDFKVRLLRIPQRRFTHGYSRNLGALESAHETLLFISQDALPIGDDWLMRLLPSLNFPAVGAAYVRQVARPNATPLETFFHEQIYPAQSRFFALRADESAPLDRIFFSNVCSLIPRRIWARFPFDEKIIMSEDQVFSKAVLRSGYRIHYNADAPVYHSHAYSLLTLFRRNFDSAYSLRGVAEDSFGNNAARGARYIQQEAVYLLRRRAWRWLAYLPIYESARILGRLAGRYAERLPRRLIPHLSLHRTHWSR